MNKIIAVIDDEPDILHLVGLHLQKASYDVREFADATSFMMFLQSATPDLIILDLMLPNEDGLSICRRLRQDPAFSSIPIIMLTAKIQEHDKVMGLELGADDYVTKPFSPKELMARVKAVLDRTVDVHIKNLRDKLGEAGNLIRNIRGVGYKLI